MYSIIEDYPSKIIQELFESTIFAIMLHHHQNSPFSILGKNYITALKFMTALIFVQGPNQMFQIVLEICKAVHSTQSQTHVSKSRRSSITCPKLFIFKTVITNLRITTVELLK